MTPALARSIAIARLALLFARVDRATCHEDGVRPETDSDHVVMLVLIACDLAPPGLDKGLIAQLATIHDLVEAYAGDAQTLTITADGIAAKKVREAAAHARIVSEFGADSWLCRTLETYEAQILPEARYVKVLDKVMPKIAHLLNGCAAAKKLTNYEGFVRENDRQFETYAVTYADCREALALLLESMRASEGAWVPNVPVAAVAPAAEKPVWTECPSCGEKVFGTPSPDYREDFEFPGDTDVLREFDTSPTIRVYNKAFGEVVVPTSQIRSGSVLRFGERGKFVVSKWLARRRGWLPKEKM